MAPQHRGRIQQPRHVCFAAACVICFVWIVDSILIHNKISTIESQLRLAQGVLPSRSSSIGWSDTRTKKRRYIVFDARRLAAQGMGNLMHGLLAAQLLGYEFHRTVCVDYPSFTNHFTYVDPALERDCAAAVQQHQQQPTVILKVVNYEAKQQDEECRIQSLLRSDTPILHFIGNSYPTSWPSHLPAALRFDQIYRPRETLLLASTPLLPDINSISHLVHLRVPDGPEDPREDNNALSLLAQELPHNRSTFLVTNQVALYQQFADCCGWSHPSWSSVQHSALSLEWTSHGVVRQQHRPRQHNEDKNNQQELQGWADWYTILLVASSQQQNTTILHSRSDFSASAVHWSQNDHRSLVLPGRPEAWTTPDAAGVELVVPMLRDLSCQTASTSTSQRRRKDDLLEGLEFRRRRTSFRHWWTTGTWMSCIANFCLV